MVWSVLESFGVTHTYNPRGIRPLQKVTHHVTHFTLLRSFCLELADVAGQIVQAAPEILVSPAMSDEATHAFGPGLVSGLREISQAFQQGLPDPVASSWLDVSGWVLDELNTDAWSDVVRAWTLTHHLITPSSLPTCVAAGGAVRAVHRRVLVGGLEPARLRGGPGEHGLLAPCLTVLRFHPDGACRRTWQRSTR